jgi:hypothetical protein
VIVCRKCSRRHPDRTEFCSCGAYLPFDGERVADPVAPTEAPPEHVPANQPASRPGELESSEPAPWSGFAGETTAHRSDAPDVDAQLPDVPMRHHSTEPVWVESAGRAGDVACPGCSTLNAPTLEFCRHCGRPLHGSFATDSGSGADERLPWWRRLGRNAKRRAGQVDAERLVGSARRVARDGVSSRTIMFRSGMVVLVALGCLAFLRPLRGTILAGARDLLGGERFDQVDRDAVEVISVPVLPGGAAKSDAQRPPNNVNDGHANTTWATRWTAEGTPGALKPLADGACVVGARTHSTLRFTFNDPVSLAKIAILGGRHAEDKSAGSFSRPRVVELEVDGECEQLQLTSEGELEIHGFEHDDVETVDLRVVDVFVPPEQPTTAEIAEVVFGKG